MILSFNTSDREKIIVGINGERHETESKQGASQKLLPFIVKILKKKNLGLEDIKAIEVNLGPGSFTGLRVGVAVAQTLGWVLKIPVNGKRIDKGEILDINYDQKRKIQKTG